MNAELRHSKRFQFSLQSILLLMSLIAVCLGWWLERTNLLEAVDKLKIESREQARAVQIERQRSASREVKMRQQYADLEAAHQLHRENLQGVLLELDAKTAEYLLELNESQRPMHAFIEHVRMRGGRVETEPLDIAFLPTDPDVNPYVRVVAVEMKGASDKDLSVLPCCPDCTSLSLGGADVSPDGLRKLQQLRLEVLRLYSTPLDDRGFAEICNIPTLQRLELYPSQITDAGLSHVERLPALEELVLDGTRRVTDSGLKHLSSLSDLRFLDLHHAKITGEGLKHLKPLRNLERLYIHGTRTTDEDLASIASLINLRELRMDQTEVTDAGLVHLKRLTNLEKLELGSGITDAGLMHLADNVNLRDLRISSSGVTEEGVARLKAHLPRARVTY